MLELEFSVQRFVANIGGERFEGRWAKHRVRTLHRGEFTDFTNLLVQIARRERLEQTRKNFLMRKRVSRFRETLRALFPIEGEPICGGKAKFRVWSKVAGGSSRFIEPSRSSDEHSEE